jgi:hypothetical protein
MNCRSHYSIITELGINYVLEKGNNESKNYVQKIIFAPGKLPYRLKYFSKRTNSEIANDQELKDKIILRLKENVKLVPKLHSASIKLLKAEGLWKQFTDFKFTQVYFYNQQLQCKDGHTIGNYVLANGIETSNANHQIINKKLIFEKWSNNNDILRTNYVDDITRTVNKDFLNSIKLVLDTLQNATATALSRDDANGAILENKWNTLNSLHSIHDSHTDLSFLVPGSANENDALQNFKEEHCGFWSFGIASGIKITLNTEGCYEKIMNDFYSQIKPKEVYFIINFHFLRCGLFNGSILKLPLDKIFSITVGLIRTKLGIEIDIDINYFKNFLIEYKALEIDTKDQNSNPSDQSAEGGLAKLKKLTDAFFKHLLGLCPALFALIFGVVYKINNTVSIILRYNATISAIELLVRVELFTFSDGMDAEHILDTDSNIATDPLFC